MQNENVYQANGYLFFQRDGVEMTDFIPGSDDVLVVDTSSQE